MSDADTPEIAPWGKWDKAALQAIFGFGAVYGIVMLVVSAIGIISEAASGTRQLLLALDGPLPSGADSGPATLIEGHVESASVLVSGLSPATSALLTAGDAVSALANLLVVGAFLYLVWRLLRREPFARLLTWVFIVAGGVLLIGSAVGQALSGIGRVQAAVELGASLDGSGPWLIGTTFDASPFGLALVLMLVASAFEYAQKLSASTRGLV